MDGLKRRADDSSRDTDVEARFSGAKLCRLAICVLPIATMSANAQPLTFDGSFRTRYESKQDFDFAGGDQTYTLSQLRLNLDYSPNDASTLFVELQDARVFGESRIAAPPVNDAAVPNIFADQLDFHQAWYEHDFGKVTMRAGRQKFNLADNRLVASLEWVNTARVHDGVRFTIDAGSREIDVFFSSPVAVDPDNLNDQADVGNRYFDSDFHGIMIGEGCGNERHLEYWYFYRANGGVDDRVHTAGARLVRQRGPWRFEIQGAYQFGDFGGLDHSAAMLHASVAGQLASGNWNASYSYGSGDDDPGDADHGTFDNLYPLNHPYYGYMDLFSLQNVHDLEFAWSRPFLGRSSLRASINGFWLADADGDAWYSAGLSPLRRAEGPADSYVGSEIDVTATFPVIPERLAVVAGISRFFGGGYLDDTGSGGDADFFFLQLSYRPGL